MRRFASLSLAAALLALPACGSEEPADNLAVPDTLVGEENPPAAMNSLEAIPVDTPDDQSNAVVAPPLDPNQASDANLTNGQ